MLGIVRDFACARGTLNQLNLPSAPLSIRLQTRQVARYHAIPIIITDFLLLRGDDSDFVRLFLIGTDRPIYPTRTIPRV